MNNKGIIGIAPLCRSYRFDFRDNYTLIDVDPEINATPKNPDVISKSVGNANTEDLNSLDYHLFYFDNITNNGLPIVSGWSVVSFQNNCNNDVKSLSVHGVSDNTIHLEADCVPWDPRINLQKRNIFMTNSNKPYNFYNLGSPQFSESNSIKFDKNPSYERKSIWTPEVDKKYIKGNTTKNQPDRIIKNPNFRDILAPCEDIIAATIDIYPDNSDKSESFYSCKSGISYAIPQVAGTVALMRSVQNNLGIGANQPNWRIPLRVYDIVTFCATKVPHISFTSDPKDGNGNYLNLNYERSIYKDATTDILADNLDRYCSPREGYGLLNAFRCVMHSIPKKANYLYEGNTTLNNNMCHLLDSKYFIHFGSKIKEGEWVRELFNLDNQNQPLEYNSWSNPDPYKSTNINGAQPPNEELNVLEWGGRHFPGNTTEPWKNNWGETILKGNTTITIPNNFVACIDGIVRQPSEQYEIANQSYEPTANCKFVTSESGKILITGFLRDVQLIGNIKTDDLDMKCSETTTSGTFYYFTKLTVKTGNNESSEIYGIVNVSENSIIGFESQMTIENKLIIQPGGEIHLKGTQGITIPTNSTLELAYGAEIIKESSASTSVAITIEDRGILKIQKGAAVTINVPIIIKEGGKLILDDNTLAWIDNIIIEEGGSIIGPDNLIPTKFDDVILLPAEGKTGKVQVMPGAMLTINGVSNSEKKNITILGGVDVFGSFNQTPNGFILKKGEFKVKWINLELGPISSTSFSLIKAEESTVKLFAANSHNNIHKRQSIGLVKATIFGDFEILYSEFNTSKGSSSLIPNSTEDDFVVSQFSIINSGYSSLIPSEPWVKFINSNFKNLCFKVWDSHLEPILNCTFIYNSADLKSNLDKDEFSGFSANSLLEKTITPWFPSSLGSSMLDLSLTNCTFKDDAADNPNNDFNKWLIDRKLPGDPNIYDVNYHLTGVLAQNLRNVQINNLGNNDLDQFKGLNYGIMTDNCAVLDVRNTKHFESRVGIADANASVVICNNRFEKVQITQELANSKGVKTYNNDLTQILYGVRLDKDAEIMGARANDINNFYNGFRIEKGIAWLTGDVNNLNNRLEEGRNLFEIVSPIEFRNSDPFNSAIIPTNIFFNKITPANLYPNDHTDIWLLNSESKILIECGYNKFARFSTKHLYSKEIRNESIPCDNNEFNNTDPDNLPNFFIRYFQVNPTDNGNIDDGFSSREEDCESPPATSQCGSLTQVCSYYRQNINWPELQGDSAVVDAEFYSALYDLCFGQLSCECYEIKARDLMQWAILDNNPDSTQAKLMLLRACLEGKRNDSTSAFFDCAGDNIIMALGEIEERMGNYQGAKKHYQDIHYFFPLTIDTMYAQWRYLYCEAMTIDTTFGAKYDSAMAVYLHRVAADISSKDTSTTPPGGQYKIGFDKELDEAPAFPPDPDFGEIESIAPNPLTNETVIRYRLKKECDIELIIYDWLGQETKTLVKGRYKKGNYVVTFQNEGYVNSSYMCALRFNGKPGKVKILQIVK